MDVELLEPGVGHRAAGREDPAQQRAAQRADAVGGVRGVVDRHEVAAGTAVDGEQGGDEIAVAPDVQELDAGRIGGDLGHFARLPEAGRAAHVDDVGAGVAIDGGRAVDGSHREPIGAPASVDDRAALQRRHDREVVGACIERDANHVVGRGARAEERVGGDDVRRPALEADARGVDRHRDRIGRGEENRLAAEVYPRLVATYRCGMSVLRSAALNVSSVNVPVAWTNTGSPRLCLMTRPLLSL